VVVRAGLCDDERIVTVLIVDDHPGFRDTARRMLGRNGLAVVGEAADGESGLTLARELDPDVILLDVALPDGSGFDIAERLRVDGPDVVLVSTRERADLGPRLDSAAALAFIQKDDLTSDAIRSLLRQKG
jgi:DNA-binding NarL/FixJ family response regulator